jgi:hypothetical protein
VGGLFAAGSDLYWTEEEPPAVPGAGTVPAAAPTVALRHRKPSGEVETLGTWPGGDGLAPAEKPGIVIGTAPDAVYVAVNRAASTELVRFPAAGAPQRIAAETGRPQAVLQDGRLYWTCPSPEASPSSGVQALMSTDGGSPARVTDWLPAGGALLSAGRDLFFAGDALYRLPRRPGPAEYLKALPLSRVTSDGQRLVLVDSSPAPLSTTGGAP